MIVPWPSVFTDLLPWFLTVSLRRSWIGSEIQAYFKNLQTLSHSLLERPYQLTPSSSLWVGTPVMEMPLGASPPTWGMFVSFSLSKSCLGLPKCPSDSGLGLFLHLSYCLICYTKYSSYLHKALLKNALKAPTFLSDRERWLKASCWTLANTETGESAGAPD